jgi:hypothetical protein
MVEGEGEEEKRLAAADFHLGTCLTRLSHSLILCGQNWLCVRNETLL